MRQAREQRGLEETPLSRPGRSPAEREAAGAVRGICPGNSGHRKKHIKTDPHLSVHWASERPNIILAREFHQLIMSFCRSTELRHFKLTVSCSQFGFCLCFPFNFTFCLKAQNHFLTIEIKQSSKTMVYCSNLT